MTTKLANIYEFLLRKYGEKYIVTFTKAPPTYISNIIGADENPGKIVFFYIEKRGTTKVTNSVSPSKICIHKRNEKTDLDLTGSPLKDDCEIETIEDDAKMNFMRINPWELEEELHRGVSLGKARAIICSQDFQLCPGAKESVGSVWFLCLPDDEKKTLLLQYEFTRKGFSRGIVHYMGVVPAKCVTMQSILKNHFSAVGAERTGIETHIANTYHIKSNITVCCSWSTSSSLPSLIDLSTCDVILNQTFSSKNCNPVTEGFLDQLRILTSIREDILSYKESENSDIVKEPVYRCGIGIEMSEVREDINKVMLEIAETLPTACTECDIEDVIQNAKRRRLNDLTDKLWEILRCCSSYKDLKLSFNILFQCAARCNIVNTPVNKNRLAEIVAKVSNRRLAIPCLSGSEPLELLLEIGLEKLYKDYEYIFVESKICSANDLRKKWATQEHKESEATVLNIRKSLRNAVAQPENTALRKTLLQNDRKAINEKSREDLTVFKNSNFDEIESAQSLAKLFQIHCAIEHLIMIHINLNLSSAYYEVFDQLLRMPSRTIDQIKGTLIDEIHIPLPAHYIRDHLQDKNPHSRRISIKSSDKFREVKSSFYFNIDNVCPPNILETPNFEEKMVTKEIVYHHWLYRKIISQ
uniref:Protein zwilch n=1 Tax=Glossina brevipalpis TaxID=37001 RepID=A0A1A9WZ23_9MUSC